MERARAKDAGIEWERPDDDHRSAQEIIDDSPLLKNLGNQGGVKDKLKERVGDFETDPDAAYRAVQVLDHVEQLDENGNRIAGKNIGNGRVDGYTNSAEARHGTEAGRLQDFGKYGFENLKGELKHVDAAAEDPAARKKAESLGIKWERPAGDSRSAQDIIDDSPLLKNLGNQSGVKDALKQQVGDFERDPDAAYRATQVLDHITRFDDNGQRLAGKDVNNSSIDGFTNSGEARHGTEAGRLQDFGKYGFDSLHGKLKNVADVGNDREARKAGEDAGIVWELPKDDDRSAKDIIDANPLLKNLGNQSGVRDAFKERVGDFENDPDAAFRASQVLDRIVGYDENGKALSGDSVANSSVDGFTNSGEAKHGTEAGRLQDFGKYGFEALPHAQASEELSSYKDYLKSNPNADTGSKKVAEYTAILDQKYDSIRGKNGSDGPLTEQNIKDYIDANPQLSDKEKAALSFWSQPGAYKMLDTASDKTGDKADGKVSKNDIQNWLKSDAPADATGVTSLLSGVVTGNLSHNVDTSKLDKDVFEHPENYTAKEKAAVLFDLQGAQKLVIDGANAGLWGDDYGKVSIANRSGAIWEPDKVLLDINEHISILQNDQPTADYLKKGTADATKALFESDPELKKAVTQTYKDEIKSGKALDQSWQAATKDGKVDQTEALSNFYATAQGLQSILGIDNIGDIQAAVGKSSHSKELKNYYKGSLATGDRLRELLKTETPEAATSAYTLEVGLYNATLDPEFTGQFDKQLNDNFSIVVQENAFKDASFDDLKVAFGKDGGSELDEDKVRKLIEQIRKESPELLLNQDGTVATADQILTSFRGNWDEFRQGTKALDKMNLLSMFDTNGDVKGAYDRGVLHGVSGLFLAGITIARGAQNSGKLTDRNIVDITAGSIQTATVLTEGGTKAFQKYINDAIKKADQWVDAHPDLPREFLDQVKKDVSAGNDRTIAKRFEESAKGVGGIVGIAAGAYGIFDGVQAIRRGDTVTGGFSITAGSLGILAGSASAIEGTLGLLGANLPRFLPAVASAAGILGAVGAGVAALGALIPSLIAEGKQERKADAFGDVLGDAIQRYGIDGIENGTLADIPDEDWPGTSDTSAD
ncbi:type III effector HrpK domain-containing protein [Pseudomonas sp. X10]